MIIMKANILIVAALSFSLFGFAQNRVEGVVLNEKGKPAKRIRMHIKGKGKIISTTSKGTFELNNASPGDTLYVYPNRKLMAVVPLSEEKNYTFHLRKNDLRYIVDGKTNICLYKPIARPSYNSNIITYEQIQQIEAGNLTELLRGKVAGLQINYADGKPKASIRGASSMSLNTEPLFIVDGTEYTTLEDANNSVSIEDIREIEVKKDGSEYGMKGANGVIIIKMK